MTCHSIILDSPTVWHCASADPRIILVLIALFAILSGIAVASWISSRMRKDTIRELLEEQVVLLERILNVLSPQPRLTRIKIRFQGDSKWQKGQ